MDLIKKLFTFNNDESSAIGLCKFNDDFFRYQDNKEMLKKRIKKDKNLTELLKRSI